MKMISVENLILVENSSKEHKETVGIVKFENKRCL